MEFLDLEVGVRLKCIVWRISLAQSLTVFLMMSLLRIFEGCCRKCWAEGINLLAIGHRVIKLNVRLRENSFTRIAEFIQISFACYFINQIDLDGLIHIIAELHVFLAWPLPLLFFAVTLFRFKFDTKLALQGISKTISFQISFNLVRSLVDIHQIVLVLRGWDQLWVRVRWDLVRAVLAGSWVLRLLRVEVVNVGMYVVVQTFVSIANICPNLALWRQFALVLLNNWLVVRVENLAYPNYSYTSYG